MRSLNCLKHRGLMVSFGNASGPVEPLSPLVLSQKGSLYLTRPTLYHYIATRQQLEQSAGELFDMVASGKVRIEVQQRFALKDAAEAHRELQARKTTGSTILTI
jgi:NADPH2:quinone reductase